MGLPKFSVAAERGPNAYRSRSAERASDAEELRSWAAERGLAQSTPLIVDANSPIPVVRALFWCRDMFELSDQSGMTGERMFGPLFIRRYEKVALL